MPKWVQVDDFVKEIADEPWSMVWAEWQTDSKEFQDFLLDPLPVLRKQFPVIGAEWRVTTEFTNHEKGLIRGAVCNPTIIDARSKTVKMTFLKH